MRDPEAPDPRNYQEHLKDDLYVRYHSEIYMPPEVRKAVEEFLPPPRTELTLSQHYLRTAADRHLPLHLYMPEWYYLIDTILVKETRAVFRALIRFPWRSKGRQIRYDLCVVLEGDYEAVTGFWIRVDDNHPTLDQTMYEQAPPSDAEARLLESIEGLDGGG